MMLLLLLIASLPFVSSFSTTTRSSTTTVRQIGRPPPHHHQRRTIRHPSSPPSSTHAAEMRAYGRGSEIWPPVNEEPILLSASFAGGVIPSPARDILDSHSPVVAPPPPPPASSSSSSSSSSSTTTTTSDDDDDDDESPIVPTRGVKRRAVRRTLSHVLSSAAKASTRRARSSSSMSMSSAAGEKTTSGGGAVAAVLLPPPAVISRGPAILALALVGGGCVDAVHVFAALGTTAYVLGLASWCAAPRGGGVVAADHHRRRRRTMIINMPSLPTGGHVPDLIKNPLGSSLTGSWAYRTWLRAGAVLGVLLPASVLARLTLRNEFPSVVVAAAAAGKGMMNWMMIDAGDIRAARRIVGGPLFLLCWQALTEAVARASLLPLPIRILIPVSYNALRLPSLRCWACCPPTIIPASLRALGIANLLYWYANLLFFLVPVGVVRYLRAHFFCVEAAEVTVRKGGESSVGLLP